MVKYIIKRLLWMIPVVLCVAILIFTIMYFCPGDPAQLILGSGATEAQYEALRDQMGLNDPYLVRLVTYLKNVFLHFDFGTSYIDGTSISMQILQRFPRTVLMALISIVIAVAAGIPLGVNAALHQGKVGDSASMIVAIVGISMPDFWFALMLVLIFALRLGWLPNMGYTSIQHYILPCIANCFNGLSMIARQTRSSMLEVLREDYMITARSKGLSGRRRIIGHALPNALIPVVTTAGTSFGRLLGGTMVIETIFSIPGIGSYMITGVNNRDYTVVQGCIIFLAIVFSILMLLVDLLYAAIDPRIKAQYAGKKRRG